MPRLDDLYNFWPGKRVWAKVDSTESFKRHDSLEHQIETVISTWLVCPYIIPLTLKFPILKSLREVWQNFSPILSCLKCFFQESTDLQMMLSLHTAHVTYAEDQSILTPVSLIFNGIGHWANVDPKCLQVWTDDHRTIKKLSYTENLSTWNMSMWLTQGDPSKQEPIHSRR